MITSAAKSQYADVQPIKTGLPQLDKLLGIGGFPRRRMIQISGPGGLGKTTIALHAVAAAQKAGCKVLYADTDYKFDLRYAASLGVDLDELDLLHEEIGDVLCDTIEEEARTGKYDLIIVDTVSTLMPRKELEKSIDSNVIGAQSLLVQRFVRHMKPILLKKNIALVLLNHERPDIMTGELKTAGGKGLQEAIVIWVRMKNAGKKIMKGEDQVGKVIKASIYQKNQLAPTEGKSVELSVIFGEGFSIEQNLLDEAMERGIITKQGQFYMFQGEKVGRGLNGIREALKGDLADKVRDAMV